MRASIIPKTSTDLRVPPNLGADALTYAAFRWEAVRSELAGLPGGGVNIAYEAVDRHAVSSRGARVAIRHIDRRGVRQDITYVELAQRTNRFANVLRELDVAKGERVFLLSSRVPELYYAALGALKRGAVVSPLFSAFGPEPIRTRMAIGEARVLVTTASLQACRGQDY